jgi:hypothetical protein
MAKAVLSQPTTPGGRALNRRVEISLVPQANACQIPGKPQRHRRMMAFLNINGVIPWQFLFIFG